MFQNWHSGHYASVLIHVNAENCCNIPVIDVNVRNSLVIIFHPKRDNTRVSGTGGGKEALYNVKDLLLLHILRKDTPSLEGSDGDSCFQADETSEDQQQAR